MLFQTAIYHYPNIIFLLQSMCQQWCRWCRLWKGLVQVSREVLQTLLMHEMSAGSEINSIWLKHRLVALQKTWMSWGKEHPIVTLACELMPYKPCCPVSPEQNSETCLFPVLPSLRYHLILRRRGPETSKAAREDLQQSGCQFLWSN